MIFRLFFFPCVIQLVFLFGRPAVRQNTGTPCTISYTGRVRRWPTPLFHRTNRVDDFTFSMQIFYREVHVLLYDFFFLFPLLPSLEKRQKNVRLPLRCRVRRHSRLLPPNKIGIEFPSRRHTRVPCFERNFEYANTWHVAYYYFEFSNGSR